MNYQEFLQRNRYQDSPMNRWTWEDQFGGPEDQIELQDRGVHGRLMSNLGLSGPTEQTLYGTEGQEGRNFLVATDRYYNEFPLSGALENWEDESPRYLNQVDFLNADNSGVLPGGSPASYQGGGLTGEGTDPWATPKPFVYNDPARPHPPPELFSSHPFFEPGETNISQGSGLLTKAPVYSDAELQALDIGSGAEAGLSAAEIADSVTAAEEGLLAIEAAEAAESGWGGPATFAANQALNLIPTRDRDKKVTPFGDEGSVSGILKGGGKGALLGATIGSSVAPGPGTAIGAAIGGGLGVLGGAQGYFDSTSAPMITMSRIKRRGGGMQGGLLGGGSMYG